MWIQRYKKNFVVNQAIFLTILVVLAVWAKMTLVGLIVYLIVMEIGALIGSMWTTRLVNKFEKPKARRREKFNLKLL